ncbi:aspartate aminotransferase family protein [Thermogymnomonas acidicola]|uniref:Aspartate aminotransferase family protein n=1 Tax=Thermogymnomonas acidicola TaxID=399579 RepID=A0AA37BPW1_9ARCH|nr:acetyl ornithine aminotransferase family protein [Thermogymnomonas acidicola]GGM67105.1 aspartate aminotransferase family protein [Thermogymnomonas acidicola]
MMKESKASAELNRIQIRVTPPGPEAKKIVKRDHDVLAKSTKSLPIVARRARGVFVEDVDGNVYLDMASGISVTNLGHVHPRVTARVEEQLRKLWHFAGTDFYYEEQVLAAEELVSVTPGSFRKKVFFTNSGTESNEAAIKIAKAATGKQQFIGFIGGFHGRTQGSLSFTASKPIQKKGFFPSMPGVEHVPFPDPYRNPFGIDGYEEPEELVNRTIDYIDRFVLKTYLPPENVAGFLVEPIQGEGGYVVPPKGFLRSLKKLADENGILLMVDEVQTGFGRTGKFFASEHFGIEPEVLTVAKAIASGIPMGAAIVHERLDFPESGLHSNTFGGNVLASVACIETIRVMKEEKVLDNVNRVGPYLKKRLQELSERYECIGDVRGIGLMLAIDFVRDRKTKEPARELRDRVEYKAFENGLILLSTGQSAIRIIPPLIITEEQADMGVEALERAIKASI